MGVWFLSAVRHRRYILNKTGFVSILQVVSCKLRRRSLLWVKVQYFCYRNFGNGNGYSQH